MNRKELEATKPKREQFQSEEEFEESLGYWMGRVGRILAMTAPSQDFRQSTKLMEKK